MPTLFAQFDGYSVPVRGYGKYRIRDTVGLDPKIVYSIATNDIRNALRLLKSLAPWQDPEAVARWRPRLEAALEDLKARHLIYGRNFRARQRHKRVAADMRICASCGASMAGKRADAKCCSDKCRVQFNRTQRPATVTAGSLELEGT